MDRYEVKQNVPGRSAAHFVLDHRAGRILGAFGTSFHRSWVYPLYTPSGLTVIREFPFDHPFHNGLFVAQNPVKVGVREGNFWAIPVRRSDDDHIMAHVGRMDPQDPLDIRCTDDGVTFELGSVWLDEHAEPLVDERRTTRFYSLDDATVCEVTSTKIASYGPAEFSQTKFGSIGLRVEERLLPTTGGEVVAASDGALRRGTAEDVANTMACDFVAYEAEPVGLERFGVAMAIADSSASPDRTGPWFIRDYGMAMFNATQNETIPVDEGGEWTASLRVVAYDGPIDPDRAKAWFGE